MQVSLLLLSIPRRSCPHEAHTLCPSPSPGNLALISAPSLNQGISDLPNQPTTLSSESEDVTTYEKLYPGFDPKQDLEVNLASCITICRWGNCQGVWCRLDKMWCDHIFGDYNTPEGAWHKAEILAPHNQLPDQKVKCLWRNCERTFPVDGLKKHIEDEHLLLYRLRCIHCGTENRDGPYRRTHGPASMCPQNPRFKQSNLAAPKSTPNPQVLQQTLPIDGTAHALNGTSNLDNLSSSSNLVANPASKYHTRIQ
uniref:Cell wall integrity transcriptional regulator CAS5 (Caspofungin sensitivity protein 5) n=1 Tax=Ganoderma boninense TaxID=34458 RepID=A0A5K1K065_9APHY|nr:Cell wall integrity transcriptional regulator CAS5 (Caspofungin sensitivity protein 5) [Ganoderma boninense]